MIHSFDWAKKNIGEVGEVQKSNRSVAEVSGLPGARQGEGVTFENGVHGTVIKMGRESVEVMIFSEEPMRVGVKGARTGTPLQISVGDAMLGETFDALGHVTDSEKSPSTVSENRPVEAVAWNINKRAEINNFLQTGVTIVDTVVPVAKGQRELVMGDQKTGKSFFLLQTIISQAKLGTVCIMGLIGKQQTEIKRIEKELEKAGVRKNCVIIAEPAKSSSARISLVPFTAMTAAEYWRDQGRDSLVVLDDLSYHALRYREMALLTDRFPGRDSYPSDIFYLHSRLLERAGSFMVNGKAVTITCMPVVTTVQGEISSYITTNIMSMTDGHLYFDRDLFFEGVRPAVNVFISVTRVGRQTQHKITRELSQKIIKLMSDYTELKRFLRFGAEITEHVREDIRLAQGVKQALVQEGLVGIDFHVQAYLFARLWAGKWSGTQAEMTAATIQGNETKMKKIVNMVDTVGSFDDLVTKVKKEDE